MVDLMEYGPKPFFVPKPMPPVEYEGANKPANKSLGDSRIYVWKFKQRFSEKNMKPQFSG